MPPNLSRYRALKGIGYDLFIGALSILSICNLIAQVILYRDPNLQTVLTVINAILLPIFLGDFFYRLWTAQSRSDYFFRGLGWADFLSSLPFQNVKILRFFGSGASLGSSWSSARAGYSTNLSHSVPKMPC